MFISCTRIRSVHRSPEI
uniref:Uncharacterized protein n=1 Tax=Anguilla anguilla TaxID=7936 RepID=A0A0E9R5A5_ANGAN